MSESSMGHPLKIKNIIIIIIIIIIMSRAAGYHPHHL